MSDEEILGYDEQSSDDEDEDIDDTIDQPLENVDGEDEDAGDWGTSRKDYYNNDQIETEADALEEEAEAKRLQQKKLLKMSEADFGLDEDEWLDTANGDDERDVITEVLKDIEITEDMSSEERLQLLRTRYPEFELLAEDYIRLQPLVGVLRRMEQSRVARIKMQALAAYLASLSMYFAILTSPAQENRNAAAIDPGELRDHGVMESLLRCRELWTSVQDIEFDIEDDVDVLDSASIEEAADSGMQSDMHNSDNLRSTTKSKKTAKLQDASTRAAEVRLARLTAAQDDLAELRNLTGTLSQKKSRSKKPRELQPEDDSDFGEEETLSTREMAEKAQKKKSLRFYTSQIAQKSNRRADAGRDAGGDADLPYRERLKDRQARLNAEAEKRGKKLDQYGRGTALGGDSDEEDLAEAPRERDEDDEYYDMVTKHSSKRKSEKADKYAAIAEAKAANGTVRVVDAAIGEDGKRSIGYVIEKNKGLARKYCLFMCLLLDQLIDTFPSKATKDEQSPGEEEAEV